MSGTTATEGITLRHRRNPSATEQERTSLTSTPHDSTFIDHTLGPSYTPDPLSATARNPINGVIHKLTMRSKESATYPGVAPSKDVEQRWPAAAGQGLDAKLQLPFGPQWFKLSATFKNALPDTPDDVHVPQPYQRAVQVYVPATLDRTVPARFVLMNDGAMFENLASWGSSWLAWVCSCVVGQLRQQPSVIRTVDRMISAEKLPPMVVIALDSGGGRGQVDQRGLEYDTQDGTFADFVESEVLPFVEEKCQLKLSQHPDERVVLGTSSGGCAAFSMAWYRPELWRRVGTWSGSFVHQQYPYNPNQESGCWDYHSGANLIQNGAPHKGMRVALHSMQFDFGHELEHSSKHNWTIANHKTAAALKLAGVACRHLYCLDALHVDCRVFAQTLPDTLMWLWRD